MLSAFRIIIMMMVHNHFACYQQVDELVTSQSVSSHCRLLPSPM